MSAREPLPKSLTGIQGLDEITGGGFPKGRPTLVCGAAGCGKTLLAMEFAIRGATEFGEPGVVVAFEESAEELAENVRSLGFDLDDLAARNLLLIDHVEIDRSEIEETGDYDLEGLFIRLGYAIDRIGAKRVVLDTLEVLFGSLQNANLLRSEVHRLFRWLKERGVTAVVTAERGAGTLTRAGMEEYVSDCVILLDHRAHDQISTRRLRIVKYRGTAHGTNEYPFLIDEDGISVLPSSSLGLQHPASEERVSTGVPDLDEMLGGKGVFRGSSLLVTGTAGTGKTSLASHFADAACRRGERCLYFAFEESERQVVRDIRSIGIDLDPWIRNGLMRFHAASPNLYGLEMHLATMHRAINEFRPHVVVLDPISSLVSAGTAQDARSMLLRLLDLLKSREITVLLTSLTSAEAASLEGTEIGISSITDTWILLRDIERIGERNRGLYILKSRGTAHSNQIREFLLTEHGIRLQSVYLGSEGMLTGSERRSQEAQDRANALLRREGIEEKRREIERKKHMLQIQIEGLEAQFQADEAELARSIAQDEAREQRFETDRDDLARRRRGDASANPAGEDPEGNRR